MSKYIITILIVFFNISIFIFPSSIIEGTKTGLDIWFYNLIPTLFPFAVLSSLLVKTSSLSAIPDFIFYPIKKIFNIKAFTAKYYILALLTGYPLGLKIASDLYKEKNLTREEYIHSLYFFNNCSIIFIIGTVGTTIYNNKNLGIFLYAIHILSSAILGVIFSPKKLSKKGSFSLKTITPSFGDIFTKSVSEGFYTLINIGSFVLFFSFLGATIEATKVLDYVTLPFISSPQSKGLLLGVFEFTNGIFIIARSEQNSFTLPLISFLLGFGGLSVIMQSIIFMENTKISPKIFIKAKLYHGIISAILTFFLSNFFYPQVVETIKIENYSRATEHGTFLKNYFASDNFYITPLNTMLITSFILTIFFFKTFKRKS